MGEQKTEIIAVGTELLLGQIANTNAQWLSEQLAELGLNVYHHSVVGDNLSRVQDVFAVAQERSDLVFVTGGLGPTEDDMTREAFSAMSGLQLIEDEQTAQKLASFFSVQDKDMPVSNRKMALIFEGADVLPNAAGMAPGIMTAHAGTTWIFLPGVPREMKSLASSEVFPRLAGAVGSHAVIRSLVLRFIGIGESKLEEELKELVDSQTNPTIAPLVADDGVLIRLTAKAASVHEADLLIEKTRQEIVSRCGAYLYGTGNDTLASAVLQLLKDRGNTVAAAESLTGGMFTEELISVPGASAVCYGGIVSYDKSVKQDVLGVRAGTVAAYGTVSRECAAEMAERVRMLLKTDIGISFTGVAGPADTEGKPAGTVFLGISSAQGTEIHECHFRGDRQAVRRQSVVKGFELLFNKLK